MSSASALVSSELAARVHWTLGRCSTLGPEAAVTEGEALLAHIGLALEAAFRNGVKSVPPAVVTGGGGGSAAGTLHRGGPQ